MQLKTDENFLNQTDQLFKCLRRLRHKKITSKNKFNKLQAYIANLYDQTNTVSIQHTLTKASYLSQQLEAQAQEQQDTPKHKPLRKIKRNKLLAKNFGGKSP